MKRRDEVERLLHRLAGRRAQARAAILFERVWPAIWPALGVAGLFVVVALLDIPRMLPAWGHLLLLASTAGAVAWLLWRGLRWCDAPTTRPPTDGWRRRRACGIVRCRCWSTSPPNRIRRAMRYGARTYAARWRKSASCTSAAPRPALRSAIPARFAARWWWGWSRRR